LIKVRDVVQYVLNVHILLSKVTKITPGHLTQTQARVVARGKYHLQVYLSFIHHQNHELICNSKVIFSSTIYLPLEVA
jgi:hypothetical protein